ncbi:MAG: hypothetical protein NC225_10670 [Clostridium sp.]|nr:hypothetical protein [Clostridium sp.]
MKNKIQTLCYLCKACNKTVYFQSNMDYNANCKICGKKMELLWKHDYKPNSGLNAIRNSNSKNNMNAEFDLQIITIECPYCKSNNTKK